MGRSFTSLVLSVAVSSGAGGACAPRTNDPPPGAYPMQPQWQQQPPWQPQPPSVPYGWPQDPLVRHNVDGINWYRSRGGLPPLYYDAQISGFAYVGSQQLARDHAPHAHFHQSSHGAPGFGSRRAENQGDPSGVYPMHSDPGTNARMQIDMMLRMMMEEGPGGGHYDNMMSPHMRRVGVGLYSVGGRLYMTNDFSD